MKLLLNGLLLLSLVFSYSCRKNTKLRVDDNILKIPLTGDVSTLDPALSYDTVSATVLYQSYESLYEYNYLKRPYTLKPLLAEALPVISKDGMTYTIKIKSDILYHDHEAFKGKKRFLKAKDFINQIKRLAFIPTKSNGWWMFENRIKGLDEFREKAESSLDKFYDLEVEGLKALDDQTLQIKLKAAFPQMIYALALTFTAPMPIEVIRFYKNDLSSNIIGTGPFIYLKEKSTTTMIRLTENPTYRKDTYPRMGDRYAHDNNLIKDAGAEVPFVKGVEFQVIKEAQTRWYNFLNKRIDYLILPKDNFSTAINKAGNLSKELIKQKIKLQTTPTLTYWWLSFNMQDPVVGGPENKLVRLAIAHAIDFDQYIQLFTNNTGLRANSIYPPGVNGYDPSHELPFTFNINKAKEYLIKAGYNETKRLTLTYDVRGSATTNKQQAEFIKNQLAKIGVSVNISLNTFPAFLEKARTGKLQFWQGGWAMDYPDAENSLQLLLTKNHPPGPNASYYSNPLVDKYFEQLRYMSDGPEKSEVMKQIEESVEKDLPWIMMYYRRNYVLYHSHLENFRHSDLIYNNSKYLKINIK